MKPLYYTITLLLFTFTNLNAQVQSYQVIDKSTKDRLLASPLRWYTEEIGSTRLARICCNWGLLSTVQYSTTV